MSSELLTPAELAGRLKLKVGTVRGWAKIGKIPCRRLSARTVRFDYAEVLSALATPAPPHVVGKEATE